MDIRSEILGTNDLVLEKVTLPAPYKGDVFVRSMSGTAWDEYQDSILVEQQDGSRKLNLKKSRAKLIVKTCCDAEGNLIFTDADIDQLCQKSNRFLETVAKVAQKLNGVEEDKKEKN